MQIDREDKTLLRHVDVHIGPGLCALMGPSGAGKSTLMDLIAGRTESGVWSGEILVNGEPRNHLFSRNSAYVLQDDLHIPELTVEETVLYSAWSRLPEETTLAQRQHRVDLILDMLGLSHVRSSIVGDSMKKGLSGGQLKRLSIAVEIVTLPTVIFLDEVIIRD